MNVLHVINGAGGGAAASVRGLATALEQHGITSSAVCHVAGSKLHRQALDDAMHGRVVFTPLYWWNQKVRAAAWKRPLVELRQLATTRVLLGSCHHVVEAARRFGADLIHTNNLLTPEGGLCALRLGLPHVWHARELVGPTQPFRLRVEGKPFGAVLARLASEVIANSHAMAACLQPWLAPGRPKLTVIQNGVDVDAFSPRRPTAAGTAVTFGMVASLASRVKNHALFVEAIARVAAGTHARFVVVGEIPNDAFVRALQRRITELGIAERVHFVGAAATPQQAMQHIDVLVHPCAVESFGRVVVEAMACGLPVIGAGGGGVAEIVDDGVTGVLFSPGDADALARAIELLAHDVTLRERLGAAGRRRSCAQFSVEATASSVAQVYERARARPLSWSQTVWGAS